MTQSFDTDKQLELALSKFFRYQSSLKIVVKSRNEIEFTKSWIEHHAGIVGIENLLLADNSSSDPRVIDVYQSFGPKLNWFTFGGHHDKINQMAFFPTLYEGLKDTARFVAFLDMDERLIAFDGSRWSANERIADSLSTVNASLIPATWLQNAPGRSDAFTMYREQLEWGVLFGKPLVSTRNSELGAYRIHTVQYEKNEMECAGLGVLHLSQFSIPQRLRTNKYKLMQRGIVADDTTYEEIAAINISDSLPEPLVSNRCIEEIRHLLAHQADPSTTPLAEIDAATLISLCPDGQLDFGSIETKQLFTEFLENERTESLSLLPETPLYTGRC